MPPDGTHYNGTIDDAVYTDPVSSPGYTNAFLKMHLRNKRSNIENLIFQLAYQRD